MNPGVPKKPPVGWFPRVIPSFPVCHNSKKLSTIWLPLNRVRPDEIPRTFLLWMDEIHFAPPKKPWHADSTVSTIKMVVYGFKVVRNGIRPHYF